jgi:hypothetical protein
MPGVLGFAANISPDRLIQLTNERRAEQGLGTLNLNPALVEAARQKASEMFISGCWSHECNGKTPWYFFQNVGYDYVYAGENLAKDFGDSEGVVSAWMASPTHRDNILNGKYNEIGIAVVDGILNGEETTLVVQLFGTPARTPSIAYAESMGPSKVLALEQTAAEAESEVTQTNTSQPVAEETLAEKEMTEKESEIKLSYSVQMLTQERYEQKVPMISTFSLTKAFYVFILILLIVTLVLDTIIISKNKIARISGKSFVHASFFIIILISVLLSMNGQII